MKSCLTLALALLASGAAWAAEGAAADITAYPHVKLSGWIKVTYQDTVYHDSSVTYPSGFEVKDAGLVVSGDVWSNVAFSIYIQGNRKNKVNDKNETPVKTGESVLSPRMVGACVDWKFRPWASFRIGQYKKPIGLEQWSSPVNYDFINTSQLTRYFVDNAYDQGLMLFGRHKGLSYWLSLCNGSPYGYRDKNWAKDVVAKCLYSPLAGLTAGGFAEYGTADQAGTSRYRRRGGLEANCEKGIYFVRGEYMIGRDDKVLAPDSVLVGTEWVREDGVTGQLMRGACLTVGVLPRKQVKLNARADLFRQEAGWNLVTDGTRAWWHKQEWRVAVYTLGADYFLNPNTKCSVNYEIRQEDLALSPVKNNLLMAQLQVKF